DGPRPSFGSAWAILSVGYLVSNVLPLRAGDGARAWLVHTRTPGDGAQALGTVVAERVVDLITILLFLGLWVPGPGARFLTGLFGLGPWSRPGLLGAMSVGAAVAGMVVLGVTAGSADRAAAAALAAGRALGINIEGSRRLAFGTHRFVSAVAVLGRPAVATRVMVWSVVVWWIGAVGYWLVFRAFALDLPLAAAVLAVCAAALFAAALPPTPGYAGPFHAAVREAVVVYGAVPVVIGTSYAIVLHALTLAVIVAMGVVGMAVLGASWGSLHLGEPPAAR
ncbi:MAG: lysylphosphatidylglycerol synthase domain-containing protein, partial [Anaerolineae bacterium]